jgi:hypothetical protein
MKKKLSFFGLTLIALFLFTGCSNSNNRNAAEDQASKRAEQIKKYGGIIVNENGGHGLVVAGNDLGRHNWENARNECDALELNGFSDWRLPSKDELNLLYINKSTIGGFVTNNIKSVGDNCYWSSTVGSGYVHPLWFQNFETGKQDVIIDNWLLNVRAVRTF